MRWVVMWSAAESMFSQSWHISASFIRIAQEGAATSDEIRGSRNVASALGGRRLAIPWLRYQLGKQLLEAACYRIPPEILAARVAQRRTRLAFQNALSV